MPSSLSSLATMPPSGRSRALLLDSDAYAVAVLRQGAALPWTDLAALGAHAGQVHSLLHPDAVWLDVEALYAAHLATRPELLAAMGSRPRTGYALRTLLGDDGVLAQVTTTARALAETTRRPVVLDLPSPARWLARAHARAGTPLESVDADRADTASLYLAEWLGRLGGLPIALVLLDARETAGDAAVTTSEALADYSCVGNVVGHFGWGIALRTHGAVQVPPGEVTVGVAAEAFWAEDPQRATGEGVRAGEGPSQSDVLLATIPPNASPESVLAQHALLT